MKRRLFMLLSSSFLAGCSLVRTGKDAYKLYVDVEKVDEFATAVINLAKAILSTAYVSGLLGLGVSALVYVGVTELKVLIDEFNQVTKGQSVIDYNNTSAKTRLDSILTAMKELASSLKLAVKYSIESAPINMVANINMYISAANTIIAAFEKLIGKSSTIAVSTFMPLNRALKIGKEAGNEFGNYSPL